MAHPTSDHRGRQLKELASEVKKLRGWAASDESVAGRLTGALNGLAAQRLPGVHDRNDRIEFAVNQMDVCADAFVGPDRRGQSRGIGNSDRA